MTKKNRKPAPASPPAPPAPDVKQRAPAISDVIGLITDAAQMRAAALQGRRIPRLGPGGVQTLMTPAEALATADTMTSQGEALFRQLVIREAAMVAAQVHIGSLEVRQGDDGALEVGPPVRPELVS